MKFADNLQKLRKKAGLSQEALAEKLDVTRQSVSKWESATSYPEMDKLIAICKIFQVDMDTLVNGDVLKIVEKEEKNGKTGKELFNKFDRLMKKVIYFFESMTAKELLSFILTIICLFIIIFLCHIPFNFFSDFINHHIFLPLGDNIGPILGNIWNVMIELIYVCFSLSIFCYILKIKYIDHITIEKKEAKEDVSTVSEFKEEKEIPKNQKTQRNVSDFLWQIMIYFLKFMAICFLLGIVMTLVVLACGIGFLISLIIKGLPVVGITIGFVSALLITGIIFEIPFNFVINHKNSFKRIGLTFILAIFLLIIGSTSFMIEIFHITYINNIPSDAVSKTAEYTYPMSENLNVVGIYEKVNYQIDNTMGDELKIMVTYYDYLIDTTIKVSQYGDTLHLYRDDDLIQINIGKLIEKIGKDLKENKLYNYEKLSDMKVIITGNETNIKKLKENNEQYINNRYSIELD